MGSLSVAILGASAGCQGTSGPRAVESRQEPAGSQPEEPETVDLGSQATPDEAAPSAIAAQEDEQGDASRVSTAPERDPWQRVGPPEEFEGVGIDEKFAASASAVAVERGRALEESESRPEWWMSAAARTEEGRVRLTAEALGVDVLDARRNAVRAGRDSLARLLEGAVGEERVELATVRRLPNQVVGHSGVARFVGYVLISAERRSEDAS